MSVKSFKFVSPGVFINEIDNSFIPKSADAIGPVVIGRSTRGLAMTPVKVESYSQFVEMFGETVPGNGGGDISRYGNKQSPMYSTYAAKAFLNANVAPLTFIRLLGQQNTAATSGYAGWKTGDEPMSGAADKRKNANEQGGAYGLWIFPSSSNDALAGQAGTGSLAAVFYVENSGSVMLSGTMYYGTTVAQQKGEGVGKLIANDSSTYDWTITVSSSLYGIEKNSVSFDDSKENFIRKTLNTNPQLTTDAGAFYPSTSARNYWLGETFEQTLRSAPVSKSTTAASVVISFTNAPTAAKAITILATNGTSATLTCASAAEETATQFGRLGSYNGADHFKAAIELSTIKDLVTVSAVTEPSTGVFNVTITQDTAGVAGNTTITSNLDNVTVGAAAAASDGVFTGGAAADTFVGGGANLVGAKAFGVILPIASGSSRNQGPANLQQQSSREAVAGWFVGQDLGAASTYTPDSAQKLFRLKGRGHGQWLSENLKVSIEKIRQSNTTTTDYGTFSLVLRMLGDTDNKVQVVERYDNLTLDPTSPNFVARKIGDKYVEWDSTNRMLKTYGEYDNKSKFIYVAMDSTVEAGGTDPLLLPFGYYSPPKFKDLKGAGPQSTIGVMSSDLTTYIQGNNGLFSGSVLSDRHGTNALTGSLVLATDNPEVYGTMAFPTVRLRHSASDGGLADPTNAYFGMASTREASATRPEQSLRDFHRLMYSSFPDDPTNGASINGVDPFGYIFTLDDVAEHSSDGGYFYASGSRNDEYSVTGKSGQNYKTLLDAGYDRFTAPFWGGFDGWDIHYPDPLYNAGIGTSATELNSYTYNTYRQAIDSVADPESLDMNMLVSPGLTVDALTTHMIDVCENRADAMALIDLANVYIPASEAYNSSKKDRIGTTPNAAAEALRDRRLDSSYGCTFYPWVQTRDQTSGQLLWIPPSVAMMGVLASSQAKSDVWFAPAGFNRGGLSDGAAGIPVTGITERLTSKERDTLYESRINPIASFPSSGIVVFGQKTLQERQSALDRINVRRLVIYMKKQISILSTQVLFEQNVQATWNRFKSLIEPFLANVKVQFGITDYKLILDESTTTPDLIDQNILYAKIMIKPARAIEYIAIDFVIASTGASFDD